MVARYADQPTRPLRTVPGIIYIGFNGGAALLAYSLMRAFGWTFAFEHGDTLRAARILIAGFGSLAFFRTSLFTLRVGSQDVQVGPHAVLEALLGAADRAVDRLQAQRRSDLVTTTMAGVSFDKAHASLPTYCLALMQAVTSEEKESLARDIDALATNDDMTDAQKALSLGLRVMNLVGPDVLKVGVQALGPVILAEGEQSKRSAAFPSKIGEVS